MHAERMKELRKNETNAESALWNLLRGKRFHGKKFRRQHGIGPYIVDFYCDEIKLVIELDGSVHDTNEAKAYDAERSQYLIDMGYSVIQFRNHEATEDLPNVLHEIERHFRVISPPFMGESEGARI